MFLPKTWVSRVLALMLSAFVSHLATAQAMSSEMGSAAVDLRISQELAASGARGAVIAQARAEVLEILQNQDSCAAWFQEVEPNVANVFRSLHFKLSQGTSAILMRLDDRGTAWYKHPWGASAMEFAGRDAIITINRNGPFFVDTTHLRSLNPKDEVSRFADWYPVVVGPYFGNTPEARMTILLHELGHIVGRLPSDDDSWNGDSARNTVEVLHHCRAEIHLRTRKKINADKAGAFHDHSRKTVRHEKG